MNTTRELAASFETRATARPSGWGRRYLHRLWI